MGASAPSSGRTWRLLFSCSTLLILMMGAQWPGQTEAKNILMVDPFIGGSHFQFLSLLGSELHARGHNITVLMADFAWNRSDDRQRHEDKFQFRRFRSGSTSEINKKLNDYFVQKAISGETSSVLWYAKLWLGLMGDVELTEITKRLGNFSRTFLDNRELHESLSTASYDLVVCDMTMPHCSILAHDILRVPYINLANGGFLGTRFSRWMGSPSHLGHVPEYLSHYTDDMTFQQRFVNVLMHGVSLLIYDVVNLSSLDRYRAECGLDTSTSMRQIFAKSSLLITNWDFVLEYPRPTLPNVIFAGGVSGRPSKPLSQKFREFMEGSGTEGVVVFSISTLVNVISDDMAEMIAGALARLPLRVVWKYGNQRRPLALGNNTMLSEWLPQGDLLGHDKTTLFVFHGGINGCFEAIYHGVPVVGTPLFADQFDNLVRLRSLGMAEYLERPGKQGWTSERLYQIIMKVSTNPSYKAGALRASRIFRAQPQKPIDRAAFWTEHVMTHGGGHLRSQVASELSWIQHNLLDVASVLAVACLLAVCGLAIGCYATLFVARKIRFRCIR